MVSPTPQAVRAKFGASGELRALLVATHPHPLLSLKGDKVWGFDPFGGGENLLARLTEEVRAELVAPVAAASSTALASRCY